MYHVKNINGNRNGKESLFGAERTFNPFQGLGKHISFRRWTRDDRTDNNPSLISSYKAYKKMVELFGTYKEDTTRNFYGTILFNNWLDYCKVYTKSETTTYGSHRGGYTRTLTYAISFVDGVLTLKGTIPGYNTKLMTQAIIENWTSIIVRLPCVQMESQQGNTDQDSDKASNTVITRDQGQTRSVELGIQNLTLREICSTEPEYTFDQIVNRWMPLPVIAITINQIFNTLVKTYKLPSFLYSESGAPNIMPFKNFVYGSYVIEFKFVVNANKFHVGKVIAAVKYDSYQINAIRNDVTTMLCRPHVILDLAANNEGILSVPFKYHRTYVRNTALATSSYGTHVAEYASVDLAILSSLGSVAGGPTTMNITPFYRIVKAYYTGMNTAYAVAQMEGVILEEGLKFAGKILNCDKPVDLVHQAQYVPKPRMNFSSGKGASDAIPMRNDPSTMTTFMAEHRYPEDPKTVLDIARVWGLIGSFDWSMSQTTGSLLYQQPIDPTWRTATDWTGVPTPLEYISSMFQFWSGPLEIRLDFVSNAFHTGAIMISAEYGRETPDLTSCASTYTKTFHLGEQKTVTCVIPYIFDTVWRRTQTVPFCPIKTAEPAGGMYGQVALLRTMSSRFSIRVVNELVPIASVPSNIQVLIYIRAGEQFTLHSPIMSNMFNTEQSFLLDSFPGNYPLSATTTATFVNPEGRTGKEVRRLIKAHKWDEHSHKDSSHKYAQYLSKKARYAANVTSTKASSINRVEALLSPARDFEVGGRKFNVDFEKGIFREAGYATPHYVHGFVDTSDPNLSVYDLFDQAIRNYNIMEPVPKGPPLPKGKSYASSYGVPPQTKEYPDITYPDEDVKPQMDNGEKEDQDNTASFRQGPPRHNIQTVDSHINIKDIMRRPLCIMDNVTVNAFEGTNYFMIPCMVPSHMMVPTESGSNGIYSPAIGRSPQVHIADLFRFARGSHRYTIVLESSSNAPIYIAYIPHSGARVVGNITYGNVIGNFASLGAFGLQTEMLLPSVNPSITIETPFDMEENWNLVFDSNAALNYSWRDKGDTNIGHLVITSRVSVTISVWWAAGDDFELSNFLGVPPCISGMSKFFYTDNYPMPSIQMESEDFPPKSKLDGSLFGIKAKNWLFGGAAAMVSTIPVVGPAVSTSMAASRATEFLNNIEDQAQGVTHNLTTTCENASRNLDTMTSEVSEAVIALTSKIEEAVATLVKTCTWAKDVSRIVLDTICDVVLVLYNQNWATLGISLARLLSNMLGVNLAKVISHLGDLPKIITDYFNSNTQQLESLPEAQVEGASNEFISDGFWTAELLSKIIGIIVGLISVCVGVKNPGVSTTMVSDFLKKFFSLGGLSVMNHAIRFVGTIFDLIKACLLWVCASTSCEVKTIQMLQSQGEAVDKFIEESQILLNPINEIAFNNPAFRLRFWAHTIKARQLQQALAKLPNNQVAPVVMRMCNDIIKKSQEKAADLRCSPIKYEPFVICLEGASGLGKSHMARKLSTDILPDLGVNSYPGDPVYFRMQGSKHWNNYLDQPVVVIDEWGNINDPNVAVEAINEWFQLKSSATFIPEQAAVEEKKTRANPKMVIALCNNAFPKTIIESVAITPEAVYRRRDVLVKVMKNSDVNMRDVKKKAAKTKTTTYDHLSFSFYKNSCDPKSLESTTYTYAEAMAEIKRRAAEYHECEMANVNARIRELQTFSNIPIGDITCDPFAIFYNHVDPIIRQTPATLPSEILEQQVLELRATMQKTLNPAQVEVEDITEEEVDSIFSTHEQDEVQTQGPILYGFAALAAAAYTHMNVVDRGAKAHCVGCKEIRSCAVACENQHYMCELCAYQYSSCCVCKGKYYMVVSEERGKMYALAQKCLKLLSVGSIVIMKYAMKFLYSAVVVGAVMAINKGVLALGVAGIIWFKYSKLTQVWREVPEREPVIIEVQLPSGSKHFKPHVSVDSVLDCTFNEVAFEEQYGQEVDIMTLDTCIHTLCYEDMANTTYDDGNFQYTTTEAYVALPLGACNETCPWRNKSYRREFCNKWYDTHFNMIKVTLLENARMDLEYAKQRYPHFAIPKWFTQSNRRKTPTIMGYNLPDWFTRTNLCKGLKYALAAISAIVVAYATYKGVGYLLSWVLPGPQAGSIISSGSDRVASYAKRYRPTKVSSFSTGFQEEQVIEAQDELLETVSDKVAKNFFSFIVTNNKTKEVAKILTGLGIKQRMGIIPRHYYKALVHYNSDEYTITIGRFPRNDLAIPYKFSTKDFIVSTYSDIAIVYLPASMNMFKNILHFIVKDSDFQRKHSELGRLVRVPLRNENYFSVLSVDIKGFIESQTMMDTDGVVMLRDVIEYNYSKPGVCGSPLLMENTQRPIYGIHVAGSGTEFTGRGFAVLISQEMFNDVPCDPVSMQAEDMEEPDWVLPLEKVKLHLPEDVNVNPLGVLPKELTPYAPQKSKIKLSLISSELNWKPKKQPCILSKNDPRYKVLGYKDSPLVAGCAKHGKLTSDFSTADLNEVRQIRFDQLMAINPLINKPEKLSIEEAITGFPNIQYYDQTNLNTSAGWPYCTTSKTLKNEYCEIERDAEGYPTKVTLSQDILNRLEKNTGLRKKGQVPFTIFVDSLKDERRPVEKLSKLGGTRIFCSSPFDFTIAMRQSFLHFIAASMAHRLEIGHAIGINLKSSETTRLVRKLLSVGENIVTIDYSNFGPGFNAGVASSAMRNIIEWTQEKVKGTDAKELSCLMHENINSIHCMSHFLYQQKGGSPSGSPITVIINTEVNDLYIKLAWLHLFRKLPNKWQEFFDNVRYFTYGDDLIMSVSDKYIDQFNGVTIQKVFQEYGIVATDATKGAEMIAYTKLKDATFLKHSFEHHPIHDHEWIAKLELDSVKEIPHWIQEPIMLKEATLVNAEAALRESYGHGPVFFEKFKRDINRALSARKLQTLTLSWEDMDKDFYPDYY